MAGKGTERRELARLVREADRPRYYATLFAPAERRPALFALYAFAGEIARVPDRVREPGLGEIRLQWWREAVAALSAGPPREDTPVLAALGEAVRGYRLPTAPLLRLIDARGADLYADPPATRSELEGLLGDTESALFQLAALVLGASGPETAEAAGHAGVAYGLARRLADHARERAMGRDFVPADAARGRGGEATANGATGADARLDALSGLVRLARDRLSEARSGFSRLPPAVQPAFLPLAVVRPLLDGVERAGPEIFGRVVDVSDLAMLVRIAAAAAMPGFGRR